MVNIRRPTQSRNSRRGIMMGGPLSSTTKKNKGGKRSLISTCRMIILFLITMYVLRMMKNMNNNTTTNTIQQQQQQPNNPTSSSSSSTRGFKDTLNDSKQKSKQINNNNNGPDHNNNILNNPKKVLMPSDNYHSHEQHELHEQQQQEQNDEQQQQQNDYHDESHHSNPEKEDPHHHDVDEHVEEPELPPDDHEDAEDNTNNNNNNNDNNNNNNNSHNGSNNAAQQQQQQQYDGNNESFKLTLVKKGSGPTNVAYVKDFEYERDHPKFRTDISNLKLDDHDPQDTTFAISIQHSMEQTVAKLVKETSVKACRNLNLVDDDENNTSSSTSKTKKARTMNPKCVDNDALLIVYNEADFPRTWCGKTIAPKTAMKLVDVDHHCTLESDPITTIFHPSIPPMNAEGMGPMIIKSHPEPMLPSLLHDNNNDLEVVDNCSIPCHKEKGMKGTSIRYFESGTGIPTPWTMYSSMFDSYFHSEAKIDRLQYRNDHYYSTQNLKSSIPRTNFDINKFTINNVQQQPIDFDSVNAKAVYMVDKACASQGSRRNKYFNSLTGGNVNVKVDAMGDCHHNTNVPSGETIKTIEGRINIMKQYRFVLAYDETNELDHISSMVWEALVSGSVPVVVSAKNIEKHVPNNSIISSNKFKNWDDMALYVKDVMYDKEKWLSYHTWRNDISKHWQPIIDKYEFSKTSVDCRMCKWGYAKAYGLGFNHTTQEITKSKLSKKLCIQQQQQQSNTNTNNNNEKVDNTKLVVKPFQEEWLIKKQNTNNNNNNNNDDYIVMETAKQNNEQEQCIDDDGSSTVQQLYETTIIHESYQIRRMVTQHDGITDIIITSVEGTETMTDDIILRLYFPTIRNLEGAYFPNTHTLVPNLVQTSLVSSASIQDKNTRITILTDWITDIVVPPVVVGNNNNNNNNDNDIVENEGMIQLTISKAAQEQQQRIRIITEDTNMYIDKITEFFPSSFGKIMTKDFVDPLELFYI